MNNLAQISEAEYEVMKIIWEYSPISTNDITDKLVKITNWSPKTIHTLIKRLCLKNIITYEKQGRMFVYSPNIDRSEYIITESESFLKRFFAGDISKMVSSFVKGNKLSKEDIDELYSILNQTASSTDEDSHTN